MVGFFDEETEQVVEKKSKQKNQSEEPKEDSEEVSLEEMIAKPLKQIFDPISKRLEEIDQRTKNLELTIGTLSVVKPEPGKQTTSDGSQNSLSNQQE